MENNDTPPGDLLVTPKRGRPRKYPRIELNVQSIGSPPRFIMTQPQIRRRDNNEAMVGEQPYFKNNNTPSRGLMVKPKRGRPRKYPNIESNVQSTGSPPGFSMNQPCIHERDNDEFGQEIQGVVEATFEDGFFLSVKVENSDIMLRGVVFKPGPCVPVSVDNDVVPHLPMIRRKKVHPYASANRGRIYTVGERRDSGDRILVPVPIQHAQPAHPTILTHRVVPVPAQPDSGDTSLVPVLIQYAQPVHPTIPTHRLVPVVKNGSLVLVPAQPALPAQPDSGDKSLVPVPIRYAQHALPAQHDHHGSANGGRKSTVRERRDSGDRSLVPIPFQHALRAQPAHPTPPAQLPLVPAPAHPTIPAHHDVPVVLQPVNQQNGDIGVLIQRAHQAIIRNPVVSVKCQPPHLRGRLPVNRGPM